MRPISLSRIQIIAVTSVPLVLAASNRSEAESIAQGEGRGKYGFLFYVGTEGGISGGAGAGPG